MEKALNRSRRLAEGLSTYQKMQFWTGFSYSGELIRRIKAEYPLLVFFESGQPNVLDAVKLDFVPVYRFTCWAVYPPSDSPWVHRYPAQVRVFTDGGQYAVYDGEKWKAYHSLPELRGAVDADDDTLDYLELLSRINTLSQKLI